MGKFFVCIFLVILLTIVPGTTGNSDIEIYCSQCMERVDPEQIVYETQQWLICENCADIYTEDENGRIVPVWYLDEE